MILGIYIPLHQCGYALKKEKYTIRTRRKRVNLIELPTKSQTKDEKEWLKNFLAKKDKSSRTSDKGIKDIWLTYYAWKLLPLRLIMNLRSSI